MAREWALAGVSEEELTKTPPIEPPKKPMGRWKNFWYHYKWTALLVTVLVVASSVFIWQMVTKDDPDYHVVVVTDKAITSQQCAYLEILLSPYGTDVDKDGKVEVLVENIFLSTDSALSQTVVANATKLTSYLASRDVSLFVMTPSYYEERIEAHLEEGDVFFAPLSVTAPLEKDGKLWNWNGSALQQQMEKQKINLPADLCFGVRQPVEGASSKEQTRCEQGKLLWETLITALEEEGTLRTPLSK